MFKDIEKNTTMLEGSYRKLKSYYYYNKNFLLMREKIAYFESDEEKMAETFSSLSLCLSKPQTKASKEYFSGLIEQIDFYAIPKKFESKDNFNKPVSNTLSHDKKMKTVNFFINMPIELHIIDALWTLFLAKMSHDNSLLSHDVYGSTVAESVIFDNAQENNSINFGTNRFFNTYFHLYSKWRNGAFDTLDSNYKKSKDSVLVSLDVKSYFYAAKCNFSSLSKVFDSHKLLDDIKTITNIMEKVFEKFYSLLIVYRRDIIGFKKREYPLPIGLFSSMLFGNLYLADFDKKVRDDSNVSFYGRYVDDLLFVFNGKLGSEDNNESIINKLLVEKGLLNTKEKDYCISGYENLIIQSEKIKLVYIDHSESRAIIDIYNDTIKIIPSQMNPIPDYKLDLSDFDENVYSIENFAKENKLRDIGHVAIDPYKVGRFFSSLVYKHINIDSYDTTVSKEIENQIPKIEKFFTGTQGIEFYSNWLSYMYFLVITQRNKQLKEFNRKMKQAIQELNYKTLDTTILRKPSTVNKRARETLLSHLDICLKLALSIDIDMANKWFISLKNDVRKFQHSNMFNHNLIALPLSNYLEYSKEISYIKMQVKDIEIIPKEIEKTFKFKWSPRFIHFEEILLLLFYYHNTKNKTMKASDFVRDAWVDKFQNINHIKFKPFEIAINSEEILEQYRLHEIKVPNIEVNEPSKINIAVGNVKISESDCIRNLDRWKGLSIKDKDNLRSILKECYLCCKEDTKILVLPELYVPIYWLRELIDFSKKSQIAIITGLQYMPGKDNIVHNFIATILPFQTGKKRYKNALVYIREKNDYSPIEKELLAKKHLRCEDSKIADYQVFQWKGIDISTFVCFEFTDIFARALLKGKCDIIATPVFNPDTMYFSNIIDSAVRDLHTIIVQANTSCYGDSRVTGPYDKNNKDIFKIKGGDNDLVIVGTIEFDKIVKFQSNYYSSQKKFIEEIDKESYKKNPNLPKRHKTSPDIKRLSARFSNKRTDKNDV